MKPFQRTRAPHRHAPAATALLAAVALLAPAAVAVAAPAEAPATRSLEGTYAAIQAEPLPPDEGLPQLGGPGVETRHYLVEDDGDRVLLEGDAAHFAPLEPGQEIAVTGEVAAPVDGETTVLDVTTARPVAPAQAEVQADGSRTLAVVMLRLGPDGAEPATADQMRSSVFTADNSVSNFFAENSFGATRLRGLQRPDGDVFGYLEIPATTGCYSEVDAGAAAAAAAGIDLSGYDNVMYVLAGVRTCSYGGWAWVGGREHVTLWFGEDATRAIAQHEIGHNLGLWHAHSLRCFDGGGQYATYTENGATCTLEEYGDQFDTMGNAYGHLHFSANHKAQLGWIPESRITTATTDGVHTIATSSAPASGPQVLRVPVAGGAFFDVEVRRPVGSYWDAQVAGMLPVMGGVLIRRIDERGQSLLDGTPDGWFHDAPLPAGGSFTDAESGVQIQVRSVDETSAEVRVTLARAYPQVYLRGTHNGWGSTAMQKVDGSGNSWTAEVRFGGDSNERFKFDVVGDWSENYGDDDRDGRVERNGADIPISQGAGTYRVTFDGAAKTYTVQRTSFTSLHPTMNLRGTHNDWAAQPMVLVADHTWQTTVWLGGQDDSRLKFDVDTTWRTNFGDSNRDGYGDLDGADIPVTAGVGMYTVIFRELDRSYSLIKW